MKYSGNNLFIRTISLLLVFTTLFSLVVYANPSTVVLSVQEELDEYIQSTLSRLDIPGASVAISHKGDLIYSQTFGKSIEEHTRFYIGSITKSFTALAIAQLVEQGKIDLAKSVSTYIKEFTVSDDITVRHLVHHVSGMTEDGYNSWGALPPNAEFLDLVRDMNKMSLTYTPGEQFAYFNPNYSLLGYIIEIVSGQSYVEYMEENIVKPLGLKNTSFTGEVDTSGHVSFFGFSMKRNEQYIKYDLPGGFMTSTAEDLILFLDAIRMNDPIVGLSPESFEKLVLSYPSDNFYSMGWMNYNLADREAIHHGGSLPGFSANAIMLPEDDYSIAILLNKNHLLNAYMYYPDLANGIIHILMGQDAPTRFRFFWIYRLLIVLFAFTIIANVKKFIKMIMKSDDKTKRRRLKSVIINLAIALGLFLLLPLGGRLMFAQRGVKWDLVFLLMPDLVTWLLVGISVHLIEAGIHLVFIKKDYYIRKKIAK